MKKRLSHIHFWCTVVGILIFIPCAPAAQLFFTVGVNSLYVALCYGGFEEFIPLVRFCGCWFFAFPVVYIASYLLAVIKKWYVPFLVLISLDVAFCLFAAVLELTRANTYGFTMLFPDIFISTAFCLLYVFADRFHKERKQKIVNTSEESTP